MDKPARQRLQDAQNAIAQQALEGIALSPEAQQDLLRVAAGEMTMEAALAAIADRARRENTGA